MEAQTKLEMNDYESVTMALQPLLRRTYELELAYLNQQKLECLNELSEAKDFLDKMRRKQSSLVSSLKLATGANAGTDTIDAKIFALKYGTTRIRALAGEFPTSKFTPGDCCSFRSKMPKSF